MDRIIFSSEFMCIDHIPQFMEMIQYAPGYFYWKDQESRYLGCNLNLCKLAGLHSPLEVIGKKDEELPWGTWESNAFVMLDQEVMLTRTCRVSINKLPIKRSDGHAVYIKTEKVPLVNEQGEIKGVLGVAIDITDEKILEQHLIQQKQENIIANMPGYIYWKNKNSEYMGCNQNLAKVAGLNDRLEIIGKMDFDFEWGANGKAEKFIAEDLEVMSAKTTRVSEDVMPIKRLDGNYYQVRTEKIPLFDDGQVVGVLAVAVDITNQKLLEQQLKLEKEKAELSDKLKTEFVKNMEHDIRTPFSGIWGMSNYLWEQEIDEEKKELLGDISRSAKELLDYCNDILDFSKISTDEFPILNKNFNLRETFASLVDVMKPAIKMRNLSFKYLYDEKIPKIVRGDQRRLYRTLMNLLSNAVKFTSKGEIGIQVILKELEKREIVVQFIVSDTGIGIPKEKQDYIYEKFYKLNDSNKGAYKGMGLGLRIVQQYIHEMEGQIDLISQVNQGSQFICTIPFKLPLG